MTLKSLDPRLRGDDVLKEWVRFQRYLDIRPNPSARPSPIPPGMPSAQVPGTMGPTQHSTCRRPAEKDALPRKQGMRPPITAQGAQRLRAELEELKSVKRPAVINAIAEARAHGDLKENAEYHAAREQQGFIEGRIKQLEAELSHAQVIDISALNAGSKVVFGATVELIDVDTEEERKYQIVGDLEADIKLGLIAISSPVARALIGKNEGDSVVIEAPGGTHEYEIVGVSYNAG